MDTCCLKCVRHTNGTSSRSTCWKEWLQKGYINEVKPQKNMGFGGVRAGRRFSSNCFSRGKPRTNSTEHLPLYCSGVPNNPKKAAHRDLGVPRFPRSRCPLAGVEMQKTGRMGMPPADATFATEVCTPNTLGTRSSYLIDSSGP